MNTPIQFLGICDQFYESDYIKYAEDVLLKSQNLLGLRRIYFSNLFPLSLSSFYFVFLINTDCECSDIKIILYNMKEEEVASININIKSLETVPIGEKGEGERTIMNPCELNVIKFNPDVVVREPGTYRLFFINSAEERVNLGSVLLEYVPAAPLTDESKEAMKSNPYLRKKIRMGVSCKVCDESIEFYTALEKSKESADGLWYGDLPDFFCCGCGKTKLNLKYLRESMHSALISKIQSLPDAENMGRAYNETAIEKIALAFSDLIKKEIDISTGEETLQKFIKNNPIVLSYFAPKLTAFKSPIGSKYTTDIVILNSKNELLLIELEKPNTKLKKANNGQHSEITTAFDQVEDWLVEVRKNRASVVDNLKIKGLTADKVANIRGVIIAGNKNDMDNDFMSKLLKRNNEIDFLTYSDLVQGLVSIEKSIANL